MSPILNWAPNIWAGVSVENSDYLYRVEDLRNTGAAIKFISAEPLIGPLPNLDLTGIDWVLAGGESGAKKDARPMRVEWVREIRDRCIDSCVPFFFKQWGNHNSDLVYIRNKNGRLLDGQEWNEFPSK